MDEYWSQVAHELIEEYWDLDLHIPVCVNGRLSKTLGTYEFKKEKDKVIPIQIQLSKELVLYGSHHFIRFILKHELCHFVLSQLSLPYRDGDDVFEEELKRIDAFSSKKIHVLYRIRCASCAEIFSFESKKAARAAMSNTPCSCGKTALLKHDVYYMKIDERKLMN